MFLIKAIDNVYLIFYNSDMESGRLATKITTCWINVNRSCNLRCEWCYAQSTNYESVNISLDDARKIIEIFYGYGVKNFIILGGEPTLYKFLPDLLKHINELNCHSTIVTNALKLADMNYLRKLKKQGLQGLNISLKAPTRKLFIKNTGIDCFDEFNTAIKNLHEEDISFGLSIVLSEDNIEGIEDWIEYAQCLESKYLSLSFYKAPFGIRTEFNDPRKIISKFVDKYDKIHQITNGKFTLHQSLPFCLWPRDILNIMEDRNQIRSLCQLLCHNGLVINPDKSLCVCNLLYDYPIGYIGEQVYDKSSLEKFWTNEETKNIYKKLLRLPTKKCEKCEYLRYCAGGCPMQYFNYSLDKLLGEN